MKPDSLRRGYLFLLDKPEGITSHDVVERVRKTTGLARIGHSGTLDPMATGLLLLCAGGAARLQGFFTRMDKTYEGTMRLGRATTTYDREGETLGLERGFSHVTSESVEEAAGAFRGEFQQSPPPYSAKKVGGRKFYEMARKGEAVPSLPKRVRVSRLEFSPLLEGRLGFSISCSSGTYIRSIANELGERLSCGAHLETLRRTRIGDFLVGLLPAHDVRQRGPGRLTLFTPRPRPRPAATYALTRHAVACDSSAPGVRPWAASACWPLIRPVSAGPAIRVALRGQMQLPATAGDIAVGHRATNSIKFPVPAGSLHPGGHSAVHK